MTTDKYLTIITFISACLLPSVFSGELGVDECEHLYKACITSGVQINEKFGDQIPYESSEEACKREEVYCRNRSLSQTFIETSLVNSSNNLLNSINKNYPNKELANAVLETYPKKLNFIPLNDMSGRELPIGKVYHSEDEGFCSATLISEDEAITAFHCITDNEGVDFSRALSVDYYFRTDSGLSSKILSARLITHRAFTKKSINKNANRDDLVILKLNDLIGAKTGFFKLYRGSYKPLLNDKFIAAGYPSVPVRVKENEWMNVQLKYFSAPACRIAAVFNSDLYSNCIPAGGMSGGPLYFINAQSGEREIVGVLSRYVESGDRYFSVWSTLLGRDESDDIIFKSIK